MLYQISELAELAGVSVRTLHHYDQMGLLKPKSASPAGYRLYSDQDLMRLQQILIFKELDFNLSEIRDILDSPGFDRQYALKAHKVLLLEKQKRLERIITSVDKAIVALEGGAEMSDQEMFDAFDVSEIEKHKKRYTEETWQRYGNSDAYRESMQRTSNYVKEDWEGIMRRGNELYTRIASLMDQGPADPQVQEAVGEWRQYITDSFYNCTPEIFRGLGDLYVADERFTANIDRVKTGLAEFLRDAIHIYCDCQER